MSPDESRDLVLGEKLWQIDPDDAGDAAFIATVITKTLSGFDVYWHTDPNPTEWISHDNVDRLGQLQRGSPPLWSPGAEERASMAADAMLEQANNDE